ncbi:DUF6503 family protein [Pedobacter glucosidilyticus]|uniref:DUF6503 family protein n=1 Tax=Pedobacter glucosidilyticus TaxID=1122941 RepID=UPI0026EFBDE4|nr:DUF6503 family protein [Pedobacter glucosidilyticus]
MKKLFFSCLFIALCLTALAQDKNVVIDKIWTAIGGKQNFEKSRYIQFTFEVKRNDKIATSRNHLWDRYTGNYRFEQTNNDKKQVILFNINTKKGKAYENGVLLSDSLNEAAIKKAYASYINDTYWLLVPSKIEDPGVNTTLIANETIDGKEYQVLNLNFDKVGLTPGDQYWLYINLANGEIEKWKFLLQNQKNANIFNWSPYLEIGNGVKLSTSKTNNSNNSTISFPNTKVLQKVNQQIFIKP